jgi:hypothetical protein
MLCESNDWSKSKELIERHLAVVNVSARQSKLRFEIQWRQNLPRDN